MFQIHRFTTDNKEMAERAMAIRRQVFVTEQGVDPFLEEDHEEEAIHYLLEVGGKAIATARWRETDKGIKLERFAVLSEFRNRGIGEIILREVLKDLDKMQKPIYLHAQHRAVPFYQRHGFFKVGDPFTEAGIEHYLMEMTDF